MNPQIKNHRVLAIVSIFASLIFGLIALNYSWQTDKALQSGDMALAARYSKYTKIWAFVGIGLFALFVVFRTFAQ